MSWPVTWESHGSLIDWLLRAFLFGALYEHWQRCDDACRAIGPHRRVYFR